MDALWRLSLAVRERSVAACSIDAIDIALLPPDEHTVAAAVVRHLKALCLLRSGDTSASRRLASDAVERWADISMSDIVVRPAMTPHSNAFHMRLAKKHASFYQSVEQRALGQWIEACRLKSSFLQAFAHQKDGATELALSISCEISARWRLGLSPRLPGLMDIELTSSAWAASLGRGDIASQMLGKVASFGGRNSPYPEDAPDIWARPRKAEGLCRFGFAATPILLERNVSR